jgi:hypothetical protein
LEVLNGKNEIGGFVGDRHYVVFGNWSLG